MARLCRLMRAPVLIPLLIGLAALFTIGACNTVESDVTASVRTALDTAGLGQVTLDDVAYRSVTLSGPDALESEAVAVAGALAATQDVTYAGTGPEPQAAPAPEPAEEPTTAATAVIPASIDMAGTVADGRVTLEGSVPDEGTRALLVAAAEAAYGPANTTDELTVAGVEPQPELVNAAADLASLIGSLPDQLQSGRFRLSDTVLTLQGEATSAESAENLGSAVEALGGLQGQAEVTATPVPTLDFTATFAAGGVRLAGVLPDDGTRAQLVAAAEAAVGAANVDDALTIEGVEAAPELSAAVDDVIGLIEVLPGVLESGELRVRGTDVDVRGVASTLGGLDELGAAIRAASAASVSADVEAGQAAVASIGEILALETITFDSGSAQLTDAGRTVLDRVGTVLIEAFAADDDLRIEVGGHTDDRGTESANLELSQARAETVTAYLAAGGVDASRLVPVGYGEAEPIADNNSAGGREQNRRIEFTEG